MLTLWLLDVYYIAKHSVVHSIQDLSFPTLDISAIVSAVTCHAVDIGAIRMDIHVYTHGSCIYVCVYLY